MGFTGRLSSRRVLYTDLSAEKCKARFNDDINSFAGRAFEGKIYEDGFYVVHITRGRHRVEYGLSASFGQEGEFTRINYRFSKSPSNKWAYIATAVFAIVMAFTVLGDNTYPPLPIAYNLFLVFGMSGILLAVVWIQDYYYRRKLLNFVKAMFNL